MVISTPSCALLVDHGYVDDKIPLTPVVCHVHLDWSSYMPLCCIRRWAFWFWSQYRFHLLKQSKWCTRFYLGRSMVISTPTCIVILVVVDILVVLAIV